MPTEAHALALLHETRARAKTLIERARMNGSDLQAYLADVLDNVHDHKINRWDELLPRNCTPKAEAILRKRQHLSSP